MKMVIRNAANARRLCFAFVPRSPTAASPIRSALRTRSGPMILLIAVIWLWSRIFLTAAGAAEVLMEEPAFGPRLESRMINVGGIERSYLLYRPKDLTKGAPLVFLLHGFTGNNRQLMESTRFNRVADSNHFALCYPQGTRDDQGRSFWENGYAFTEKYARDDVRFLKTLARQLQKTHGFSKWNTFAAGMSNGAEMSIMLALFAPDTFHAIAAVSGCVMEKTYAAVKRPPRVPAFFICGDADKTTRWDGDMANQDAWGAYRPVKDMIELFTRGDKRLLKTTEYLPDVDTSDQSHIVADRYRKAATGHRVWFYHIVGGGHDWPGSSGNKDIDAAVEIWRYFSLNLK